MAFVADPAVCDACPVKAACTPGKTGRHVHRSLHEPYLDRVRAYHATESYKKAMRNGRSGSSRCSARPNSGTTSGSSGCAACPR